MESSVTNIRLKPNEPAANKDRKKKEHVTKADWKSSYETKKRIGVEDMTLLGRLDNNTISSNLELRFQHDEIYTYIGYVLVSVNPYKELKIYDSDILQSYVKKQRIEVGECNMTDR
jgi:myosin-1